MQERSDAFPLNDAHNASRGVDFHLIAGADVSEDARHVHNGWNTEFACNDGPV
jgi:hypothetical protein